MVIVIVPPVTVDSMGQTPPGEAEVTVLSKVKIGTGNGMAGITKTGIGGTLRKLIALVQSTGGGGMGGLHAGTGWVITANNNEIVTKKPKILFVDLNIKLLSL